MKSPHNVILSFLICIVSSVALTSCSPSPKSFVGEWQTSKPESVTLKITLGAYFSDAFKGRSDFRDGFSYTMNGLTYNSMWLIETDYPGRPGTFLRSVRREGASLGPLLRANAQSFKVIEITSDKLVINLYPLGTSSPNKTYEFHRVK